MGLKTNGADLSTLSDRDLADELAHRGSRSVKLRETLHAKQRDIIDSTESRVVALCGRRSGKTVLDGVLLADALEASGFDEVCVYVARTRDVARRLIWAKLHQIAREQSLDWKFNESNLEIHNTRGAAIWVVGADKQQELEKLRGAKMRIVILDEPATYAHLLEGFIDDVIEPALGDLRGRMIITGTPGIVCAGWWFRVSTGLIDGWHIFHWTVLDNPFFRDPIGYLKALLARKGWTEQTASYLREQMAQWVHNVDDLVYRVTPENVVEAMPLDYSLAWYHVLAIDYGVTDSTAWCVLAWSREPPTAPKTRHPVYVVASEKAAGKPPSEIADITKVWWDRYRPVQTVGDAGGLGKAMIAEMNARYPGVPMTAAEKTDKRANIEILNGDLSTCNLLIVRGANRALLAEAAVLPWKEEKAAVAGNFVIRQVPHPGYEDHLCDAMLYGWRATTAQWPTKPPTMPRNVREWMGTAPTAETWDVDDREDLFG